MEMNWCYYFINLQQKATISKNWGGPEKDRFFLFFLYFYFFIFWFLKSFVFRGEGGLLSSVFSSIALPHLRWSSLSLFFLSFLLVHYLLLLFFLLLPLGGFYLSRRRGQSHTVRHRPALFLCLFYLFFSLLFLFFSTPESVDPGVQ